MFPQGSSGCSHKLRQSSHAVGSCGNFFRSPFFPLSTAKGRCLQQLLAVHFDSRHRDRPMSSRLLFALSGTMRVPVAVLVPGWLSPSLSRRDRTWCHHQIGFVGSVPSWWTSRDPSGISGLCSGRFDLNHGHHPAKPESARMPFGLRSGSGNSKRGLDLLRLGQTPCLHALAAM